MKALLEKTLLLPLLLAVLCLSLTVSLAKAESAAALQTSARHALQHLYKSESGAAALGRRAAGILVFPEIIKGGFIVGAQYGNGVLFKGDKVAGYYNTTSGSFGYQAGVQKFGYALFFMTPDDLHYLESSAGWEIGTTPNITVIDKGVAASISSTTLQKGMYAFFFEQKGLMAGLSLQGTKVTRIHPD